MIEAVVRAVSIETETIIAIWILSRRSSRLYKGKIIIWRPKWTERVACKIGMRLLAPKSKQSYLFLAPLHSGLGKAVAGIYPGRAMQWDTLAFLPHPTDITDIAPPPTIRLCSLRSAGLVKRVWPAPDQWLRDQMAACWAGFTSPVAMSCHGVCAFVLLRCFSCSHTVLPKEHSLGVIFFLLTFLMSGCIFLQFYLHFTTDYTLYDCVCDK